MTLSERQDFNGRHPLDSLEGGPQGRNVRDTPTQAHLDSSKLVKGSDSVYLRIKHQDPGVPSAKLALRGRNKATWRSGQAPLVPAASKGRARLPAVRSGQRSGPGCRPGVSSPHLGGARQAERCPSTPVRPEQTRDPRGDQDGRTEGPSCTHGPRATAITELLDTAGGLCSPSEGYCPSGRQPGPVCPHPQFSASAQRTRGSRVPRGTASPHPRGKRPHPAFLSPPPSQGLPASVHQPPSPHNSQKGHAWPCPNPPRMPGPAPNPTCDPA